jgi:hypothetical protein
MADNAGDRALAAATQLERIGFVEFSTHLVRDTYRVIIESSMDQLKAYADFVSKVAEGLSDYQDQVIGETDEQKKANAHSYIEEVLQLEVAEPANDDQEFDLDEEKRTSLEQHFLGVLVGDKDISTVIGDDNKIKLGELRSFVLELLKKNAKESYDLLKTILKIGMQKVVVTNGQIRTKLTFSVDATDTYTKTESDYQRNASRWGVRGSISGRYGGIAGKIAGVVFGNFIGGGIGGGYGSSKLNVAVVNEKSTAATNIDIDILGEVNIQFRTETFPSVEE